MTPDGRRVNIIPERMLFSYVTVKQREVIRGSDVHQKMCSKLLEFFGVIVPRDSLMDSNIGQFAAKLFLELNEAAFDSLYLHTFPTAYKAAFKAASTQQGVAVAATSFSIMRYYSVQLLGLIFDQIIPFGSTLSHYGVPWIAAGDVAYDKDFCLEKLVNLLSFGSVCEPAEQKWINWNQMAFFLWSKLDEMTRLVSSCNFGLKPELIYVL